ncbi:MBL fold metallo-hydrolase [Chloroflexota bacterium]
MKCTILGSGGCTVIPKPLCQCQICVEARKKGIPYSRGGPSAFLHDINLLIDTPAEISSQLNRSDIQQVEYIIFTHLDPDHTEGFRVVEQIALDFRSWQTYPEKQICLLLPQQLKDRIGDIKSQYGPVIDFYQDNGFIKLQTLEQTITIDDILISAIPVNRGTQISFIYTFEKLGKKLVYAPCDIKPFPEHLKEVQNADVLIIQPGIFEERLKHDFRYPLDHVSRNTLYTFEQTLELARRLEAKKVLFTHVEEYWNRSHDDYLALESDDPFIQFAYDGMQLEV